MLAWLGVAVALLAVVVAYLKYGMGKAAGESGPPEAAVTASTAKKAKPAMQKRQRSTSAKGKKPSTDHAHPRFLSTLKNHTAAVTGLQFSPGGQYLATISLDRTLRLWSMDALEGADHQHQRINIEDGDPVCLRVSADGKYVLVVLDRCNTVQVYGYQKKKGKDGKASRLLKALAEQLHSTATTVVSVDLSSKYVLTCGAEDVRVNLLSLKGELLHSFTTKQLRNNRARFSAAGRLVAVAARTNEVKVWRVEEDRKGNFTGVEKKMQATAQGHQRAVTDLAFVGEDALVTCSLDGTWKVWNVGVRYEQGEDPRCTRTAAVEGFPSFSMLALSPDGRRLALAYASDFAVCTVADGRTVDVVRAAHAGDVECIGWDASGTLLATGAADKLVRVWRFP